MTDTAPNLFKHEQRAKSIEDACQRSRTRFLWIVTYLADYTDFDFLWEPKPWEAHQRHAWPSQWQKDSETYLVPKSGYTETNYHSHPKVKRIGADGQRWIYPGNLLIPSFDWSWHPDPTDPPMTYVFPTRWQRSGGPVYKNGSDTLKFMDSPRGDLSPKWEHWETPIGIDLKSFDFSWNPDSLDQPYIYQFGTQWQKTGGPRYSMPGATEVKYVRSQVATKISKDSNWVLPNNVEFEDFDYTWHPDETDPPYIYQFGTQHQKTGGPCYIVPGATEIKYVSQIKIKTARVATAIYEIDHMDGNAGQIPNTTRRVRYFDNYRDTLIRLAKSIGDEHEFVWVCSSICDYSNFDFSWHPETWQASMLHVFASNDQKFGDTFFMHVPSFVYKAEQQELLEWYDLNFVPGLTVPRRPMPIFQHNQDTHVDQVRVQNWAGPLALFTKYDYIEPSVTVTIPLWREKTKTIVPLSAGATSVVVPKTAIPYIKTQLYDYPYIDRTKIFLKSEPLDIVFISNGETNAESNFLQMQMYLSNSSKNKNKVHRVTGINGRVAAYHAAAKMSTTDWFFAVFAKIEVDQEFDWNWQPDCMQEPKHYIFHAVNPVNGLVYGHQAIIAYNRKLTLSNPGQGLDFTLDSEHEVVPIVSGIARYNTSPWSAWRTAFRECIKLKASLPDVDSKYRLQHWLNTGWLDYGNWSMLGAQDAVEFYDSVKGNFDELKKSYEWEWLSSYAFVKRGLTPDQ